jgi:hypothetical protein
LRYFDGAFDGICLELRQRLVSEGGIVQTKFMSLYFLAMLLVTSFTVSISQGSGLVSAQKSIEEQSASQGGDISGGGSAYEADFKAHLDNLIERLEAANLWQLPVNGGKSTDELTAELEKAKVSFAEQDLFVIIDGIKKDVDAINYPKSHRIDVDSRRWVRLNKEERESLVLHEFFGLLEIERNKYTWSENTLAMLRRLENRLSPEDECPIASLGTHGGDGCLMRLYDIQRQDIEALQVVLAAFGKPHAGDPEYVADLRVRVKKFIKSHKANYKDAIHAQCELQITSEGNMAAYDWTLCEIEMGEKVLKTLRQYHKEIKANNPIPEPAPNKGWNG